MDWLERHLPHLASPGSRVLELGCGTGVDTPRLLAHGFEVLASDVDSRALIRARAKAGEGRFLRLDHSRPLPFSDASFDAVVASLTLHYFPWEVTRSAVGEVRRVLQPGSGFLFRVNATDDINFGANDGVEVEPHLRRYSEGSGSTRPGQLKRFFDEADVRALLDGSFEIETLEHREIQRRERVKRVWECRARAPK